MKKHNLLKVILFSVLVVCLCAWIFPTASYSGDFIIGDKAQVGLFDLTSYPMIIFSYFGYVAFYILCIGAFYGVLSKIPAYRKLLDKIAEGFKGHETIFLSLVVVLVAIVTSVTGLSVGVMFLFPLIISLVLLMGYNKNVAALVTVGSAMIGTMGITVGYGGIQYFYGLLSDELTIETEMSTKIIILVIGIVLLLFNVLRYASKTKNKTEKEVASELLPEQVEDTKKKVRLWPLVVIFDVLLVLFILGLLPWDAMKVTIFEDALTSIKNYTLFDFPILSKLLGSETYAFGKWSLYNELPAILLIASVLLSLIYLKFDQFLDGICEGMKKAAKPAILMSLVYLILVITTNHSFQLIFVDRIAGLTNNVNVLTTSFIAFFTSIFNVEATYVAQRVLPYFAGTVANAELYPLIGVIFQAMYGLTMLIAPTSVVLIGTLAYLDVSYTSWLKNVWKLFFEILAVLLIIFVIILAI